MNAPARTIVCTVGTSVANGCGSIQSYYPRTSEWEEDVSGLKSEIQSRLDSLLDSDEASIRASAEIHSLHRLGCGPSDEVIFFTSDTAEGKACGESVLATARDFFGLKKTSLSRVVGLQARDSERLKRHGIPNLVNSVAPILQDPQKRYSGGVILNPTGGFKGVVPFMTVLGMLYGAKVVYMFEYSKQLITLPPLPVSLDSEVFERARPAIEWAKEHAVFPPSSFYGLISGFEVEEESLFSCFLEIDSVSEATLSPLAMVLVCDRNSSPDHLMISAEVRVFFEGMSEAEKSRMQSLIWRLASPQGRSNLRKSFHGTDLEVFGRERFAARFAGYTKNGIFHLCLALWVTDHDEYEKVFASKSIKDFESKNDFTRMERPEDEPLPTDPEATFETWAELKRQNDGLLSEIDALKEELARSREFSKARKGAKRP